MLIKITFKKEIFKIILFYHIFLYLKTHFKLLKTIYLIMLNKNI